MRSGCLKLIPLFFLFIFQSPQTRADDFSCNTAMEGLLIGDHRILDPNLTEKAQFTSDGKKVLAVSLGDQNSHSVLTITNVGTHQMGTVIDPFAGKAYPGVEITISKDGNYVCFVPDAKYKALPMLYDVRADKFTRLPNFDDARWVEFSPNSRFAYGNLSDSVLGIYDIENKTYRSVRIFNDEWTATPLENSNSILIDPGHNGYVRSVDLETGSVTRFGSQKNVVSAESLNDGESTSQDGKFRLSKKTPGTLKLTDTQTGEARDLIVDPNASILDFSFLGKDATLAQVRYTVGDKFYLAVWNSKLGQFKKFEIPFMSKPQLSDDGQTALFYFEDPAAFRGGQYVVYDLETLSSQIHAGKITRSDVKTYFTNLLKPGVLDLKKHANEIFYFFESGLFRKNKMIAQELLLNVVARSTGMYETIINRYPDFAQENYFFKEETLEKPREHLMNGVVRYLEYFNKARANARNIIGSIKYLKALHNYFYHLSLNQMNDYTDDMVEALADAAEAAEGGIFKSMIYKFCEQYISPIFWLPSRLTIDVGEIRQPYSVERIIFSTQPDDEGLLTKTPFGYYEKRLPKDLIASDVKVGEQVLKQIDALKIKGVTYRLYQDYAVEAMSLKEVLPLRRRMNLKQMTRDKRFEYLVLIGSNYAAEDQYTVDAYKLLFKQMGLKEVRNYIVNDTENFFLGKVKNGTIDVWTKEAHSDGVNLYLMRINVRNRVIEYERVMKNGLRVVGTLVIPMNAYSDYSDPTKTVLITNEAYGEAVRAGEQLGLPPLYYISASCWSWSKAMFEIETVFSKRHVMVATTMPTVPLERRKPYSQSNAESQMIDVLFLKNGKFNLNNGTFNQAREAMMNDPDYAHRTGNTFVLPDDPLYEDLIKRFSPALIRKVTITQDDGTGEKPYYSDE